MIEVPTDEATRARVMAAKSGIPAARVAIAELMADGRERTALDIVRDTGLTLQTVRSNCYVMVRMGLLACDNAKSVGIYRVVREVRAYG